MDNQPDLQKSEYLVGSRLGSIFLFIITLGIGVFLGRAIYKPNSTTVQEYKEVQTSKITKLLAVAQYPSSNQLSTPVTVSKVEQLEFETPQEVIAYLSSQEPRAFRSTPLYRKMQQIFQAKPDLAFGMLSILLDIADPKLKVNVSSVLNNFLIKSETNHRVIERPAVDWVLEQIKNQNRPAEWLEILSHWGAKTRSSAYYLHEQLSLPYPLKQKENILQALSGANTMNYPMQSKFSPEEIAGFARTLEPFLEHESEKLRFAAVDTLKAFSSEALPLTLLSLANDQSERIRMKAMEIAVDHRRVSPELKAIILKKIHNPKLRPVERVFAFGLAKRTLLSDQEYEQLYKFKNETLQLIRQRAKVQSKEIDLYSPVYYEF